MSVADLIGGLEARGAQFWVEFGQLKFRMPPALLESPELGELRRFKQDAIDFLTNVRNVPVTPPTLEAGPRPPRLPLSVTQEKFFELEHNRQRRRDHPSLVLSLKGEPDRSALRNQLPRRAFIAGRNEILRTRYCLDSEGVSQVIDVALVLRDRPHEPGACRSRSAGSPDRRRLRRSRRPPASTCVPVPCCARLLIELAADDHVFIAVVDHIAVDNISWSMFVSQLFTVYRWRCAGNQSSLPAHDSLNTW